VVRRFATIAVALAALGWPTSAAAHAVLQDTEPRRGASLDEAPPSVDFHFDEPVEASFGAVRVYDRGGERVDTGELLRPGDSAQAVGVALPHDLGDGTYTATYRVVSADSHPVSGGFVFTIGDPTAGASVGLDELIDDAGAGPVTDTALGAARIATYVATALLIGAVAFLLLAWAPAVRSAAGGGGAWVRAAEAFARRLRALVAVAIAIGVLGTAAGIVLQGAVGLGDSFWSALRPAVIEDVLTTRFGTAWGLRLLDLGLLAALLLVPAIGVRYSVLAPARLGATGNAAADPLPAHPVAVVMLGLGLGFLALVPALSGHAGVLDPGWVLVPANFVHVLAFAAWAGGLAVLAAVVPAATRELDRSQRTSLLAAVVWRFSTLALVAVALLLATGMLQAILELEAWSDLLKTGYGRAILVKAVLLGVLIGLGAINRQRLRPRLSANARDGEAPGATGLLLRRLIRAELVLIGGVLAATAVLAALAPPVSSQAGPYSTSAELGDARLEVSVDPATAGSNEIHLYLFDVESGVQWDEAKEVAVTATQAEAEIGPLEQDVRRAGPGHYVVRDAALGVEGEWRLAIAARVSAFEELRTVVEVPIG
jgi:copper transport protein